ncbi:MAG: hypothetical protein A2Y17_01575 [Clostridiales bacterium GWF2_38_85]|nr:MAG: hypothetical protein A2Y17_01575 [Clostridiales bacterium GWF2_38_85]HBL84802.1 hypothetical protein [Clostridiales bacterium]
MSSLQRKKRINYINALKISDQKNQIDKTTFGVAFSLVFFIVALASVYLFFVYQTTRLETELKGIKQYTENESNKALYDDALKNENVVIVDLMMRKNILTAKLDELNSVPILTKTDFEKILACSGDKIVIYSYNYINNASLLTFEAAATETADIPEYISRLEATGLFGNIEYNGYNLSDTEFYFTVDCYLKVVSTDE